MNTLHPLLLCCMQFKAHNRTFHVEIPIGSQSFLGCSLAPLARANLTDDVGRKPVCKSSTITISQQAPFALAKSNNQQQLYTCTPSYLLLKKKLTPGKNTMSTFCFSQSASFFLKP